jgi:carotenoid cleavage dioxygenase
MNPPLPIDGVLPPDLQGTLLRVGPGGRAAGALHGVELRDGAAVSYRTRASTADANVFWHAGSVLALSESGLPQQFSRALEPEEFGGGLTRPIASHVHLDPATGARVLFGVEPGDEAAPPVLHLGEWDAAGALARYRGITLERATWQHDIGVTARQVVFLESPTEFGGDLARGEPEGGGEAEAGGDPEAGADPEAGTGAGGGASAVQVPYRWTPGAESWIGVVDRAGDGSAVRWIRQDPCLVTHVLNAHDEGDAIVLHVVRYRVPEAGQPVDLDSSVVGSAGVGASLIGGGLGVLERWRIEGTACEQVQVDDRAVEYVQTDPACGGQPFRYGYGVALGVGGAGADSGAGASASVRQLGLLQFDVARDEVREWRAGEYRVASEPLFVRAADGHSDDEGWLLTVVHDAARGESDLCVLDASSFGRCAPQAVIHLPGLLAFRSHGTWVGADRYR